MSCSGSNQEGESSPKEGVVNRYLNSVMAPPKTMCFKEGVMLVEEVKAPKATGTVEERLDELEDKTFRYGTVVYRSLDAHHFMNLELEKKVEEYKKRLEDLEDRYKDVINKWEKFQCFMWDVENQNCEYEERFKKIAAAATLRYNDPPTSFRDGRPFPWKMAEWEEEYEKEEAAAKKDLAKRQAWGSSI